MRKINKSASVPPTLKNVSAPTNPSEVRETVYRANDVRQQLMKDQFHKCAYCECRVTLPYNDVEHYRPKASYYWLAYEWSNLLYACSLCNRTYKKAFFPLVDESQKVTAPGSLEAEKPLLINPAVDIPTDHVKFRRHEIVGVTDKGRETIKLLHLNDRIVRNWWLTGSGCTNNIIWSWIRLIRLVESCWNQGFLGMWCANCKESSNFRRTALV